MLWRALGILWFFGMFLSGFIQWTDNTSGGGDTPWIHWFFGIFWGPPLTAFMCFALWILGKSMWIFITTGVMV